LAGLGLLAVTAVLLLIGAELFTENAAGAARRLQITLFATVFLLAGAEPEGADHGRGRLGAASPALVSSSGL
jgi:hypothetical protein